MTITKKLRNSIKFRLPMLLQCYICVTNANKY
nr:MAG TPA: hypothetical protein [Caudoviricetes sp.]